MPIRGYRSGYGRSKVPLRTCKGIEPARRAALSLQSMGNIYMHLKQFEQALSAFKEAEKLLSKGDKSDNNPLLIRIYLHNVHVRWSLNDLSGMSLYLDRVASYYNTFAGNSEKALLSADSALVETRLAGNLNEYRNSVIEKAALLEKMRKAKDACDIYQEMEVLTDSLDMQRYTRQIEHLHATYLADQLEMENRKMDNARFAWFVGGCCIVLLGIIALVFVVRRKNQELLLLYHKLMVAREETTRSVYSKSMLLSNMSHELRTPFNAIVGFSDLLSNSRAIDADIKKRCGESIRQNAGLLKKLIKDVMDFSEFNIGEMSFTCERHNAVSICKLVVDMVDSVKQTAAQINFKTSCEELYLYTDSGRLQQVHIFERFEKLHEGVQGSGSGLSICQLIVEHLGGSIWIDSSYVQGARLIFTHPLPPSDIPAL